MDSFLTEQENNQIYLRKKSDATSGVKVATKDTIMKVYHEYMLHIHTVTLITFEKSCIVGSEHMRWETAILIGS